jgi:hypothetical protein
MKTTVRALRRVLREQLLVEDGASNLGKVLDDLGNIFTSKMQAQFPHAGDIIKSEATELKTQCAAQIRAAAAKVKMSAKEPNPFSAS